MDERQTIEEKLRKKESEIHALEDRLKTARIYVQALQDVLKSLDRQTNIGQPGSASLKQGSAVAQARDIILERNQPVHIIDLLEKMGKDADRESRASLTSSISAYVRRGEIFTRPAPNTFGLIELGHDAVPEDDPEPPSSFGEPVAPRRAPPLPPKREAPPASPAHADIIDDDIPF